MGAPGHSRRIFALRVRIEPGVDAIRNLRRWLKLGLRQFGIRCIDAREETTLNQFPATRGRAEPGTG